MGKRMTAWTKAGYVVGTFGWLVILGATWTDFLGDPVEVAISGIIFVLCGVSLRFAGIEETLYDDAGEKQVPPAWWTAPGNGGDR